MLLRLVAIVLIVLGIGVVTLSVLGALRGRTVLLRTQYAGTMVVLGNGALLAAAIGTGDWAVVSRAALVAFFLAVTSSASAHAIALAAHEGRRQGDEGV